MIVLGPFAVTNRTSASAARCRACFGSLPSSQFSVWSSMSASMRSRISCSQNRARSPSRFHPTNSSRTAEAPAMTRSAPRAASRAADGGAQPSDGRLIALFLDMLAAERGAAPNTLAAYRRDLADFASYLAGAGATVKSATTEDVRRYLGALARRGLRPASVARRLSAIRQLYRFLYAERQRKDDPAAVLEGPKRTRPLPKTLSLAEVDRLLGFAARCDLAAALSERVRAARLACLVELLYATGLRVSELVALPIAAARRDARVVVVRGKGNKERLVPLNDAARRAIADYLALRELSGAARSQWLFPSFGDSGHLTRQHLARELKSLARAAGLRADQVSP